MPVRRAFQGLLGSNLPFPQARPTFRSQRALSAKVQVPIKRSEMTASLSKKQCRYRTSSQTTFSTQVKTKLFDRVLLAVVVSEFFMMRQFIRWRPESYSKYRDAIVALQKTLHFLAICHLVSAQRISADQQSTSALFERSRLCADAQGKTLVQTASDLLQ